MGVSWRWLGRQLLGRGLGLEENGKDLRICRIMSRNETD